MKKRLFISIILFSGMYSIGAVAQLESMTPSQLLTRLFNNADALSELIVEIQENQAIEREIAAAFDQLDNERAILDAELKAHEAAMSSHNAEVEGFNEECGGGPLEEEDFARCRPLSDTLNASGAELDRQGMQLQARVDDFTEQLEELNRREEARLMEAQQLMARNNELESNIAAVQSRFQQLAVERRDQALASGNRSCSGMTEPLPMYRCLRDLWRGAN